jgi:hypothetical protein
MKTRNMKPTEKMTDQWPPASGVPAKIRFKKARSLKWGETPFDDLTRAELLRLVQAYHLATVTARGVMMMHAEVHPSLYWADGHGGRALSKINYLVSLAGECDGEGASEMIYRSFFRTANVLLFPHLRFSEFSDWGIDDKGQMLAPHSGVEGYRRIEWRDMTPMTPLKSTIQMSDEA